MGTLCSRSTIRCVSSNRRHHHSSSSSSSNYSTSRNNDNGNNVGSNPTTLMPSHRHDPAVFNIPFATTVANPSRPSVDGDGGRGGGADGTWGSRTGTTRRERRQTQQVPLPPAPGISRKIPDMLGRNVESSEDINASVDEDRRNRPRVLKVRRLLLLLGLCVADWERAWVW